MWFVLANWTRRNVTKAKTWKVLPYWSLPFLVTGDLRHQVKKPRLAFWIRRDHMERGFSHLPSHHPIGVPKHVSEAILGHPIWVKLMKNGKITFSSPERVEINTTVVFLSQHSGGLFCAKTNKQHETWETKVREAYFSSLFPLLSKGGCLDPGVIYMFLGGRYSPSMDVSIANVIP